MPRIRATHVPDRPPIRRGNGPAPAVRYAGPLMWPGITTGNNALCLCTWAHRDGRMEVKFANRMCGEPGHAGSGRG